MRQGAAQVGGAVWIVGGDEEGRVLVAKCCAQPLHAACFRQHVAARAYQDPNSDEETATLTRTRVKCPACNVTLRSTSAKRVLRDVESDVVVNAVVAPPDPPPSPPTDGQTWLDYARRGGQLRDWSAAVALTALAADDRATLPIVVSIEAAVGAGKSSLLKLLRMLLQSPTVLFVPEPVDTWRETGMLRRYYAGEMSALEFQLAALTTIYAPFARAINTPNVKVVITERSLLSNLEVFAKMNLSGHGLRDFTTVYDALQSTLPARRELVLYLEASPDVLTERIAKRGRPEEAALDTAFHSTLIAAHERMCATHPSVVRLDANRDAGLVFADAARLIQPLVDAQHAAGRPWYRRWWRRVEELWRMPWVVPNAEVQGDSMDSTSINLGNAADSVSQQDYRMADLPIERIPDSVTRVNVVAQQQGAPTITLVAARHIFEGEVVAQFGSGWYLRKPHWQQYCEARGLDSEIAGFAATRYVPEHGEVLDVMLYDRSWLGLLGDNVRPKWSYIKHSRFAANCRVVVPTVGGYDVTFVATRDIGENEVLRFEYGSPSQPSPGKRVGFVAKAPAPQNGAQGSTSKRRRPSRPPSHLRRIIANGKLVVDDVALLLINDAIQRRVTL